MHLILVKHSNLTTNKLISVFFQIFNEKTIMYVLKVGKAHVFNEDLLDAFNVEYQFSVIMSRHCTLWLGSNRSLIWMSGIIRLLLALSPHLNCNQQVYSAYLPEDCNMNPKFITKRLSKEIRMTWQFLTIFNSIKSKGIQI